MVRLTDMTEEKLMKVERRRKIKGLIKDVFGEEIEVENIDNSFFILNEKSTGKPFGTMRCIGDSMLLRQKKYEDKAKEFGRRYEKEIGLLHPNMNKDFIIETDYSRDEK